MSHASNDNLNPTLAFKMRNRSGFSLIEILVALMIIGILTALILPSLGRLVGTSKVAATEVTIQQIDEVIQARAKAIAELDLKGEAKRFANAAKFDPPNGPRLTADQAEFILRKELLRQALPQRVSDLWGMDRDFSTKADNNPHLQDWVDNGNGPTAEPAVDPASLLDDAHSSEVLYWALTEVSSVRATVDGKSFNVPVLDIDRINVNHISNSVGDSNLNKFVDEWEKPLQFYTWSTRLVRPDGVNGSSLTSITQPQLTRMEILVRGLQGFSGDELMTTGADLRHPLNQDPHDPTGRHVNAFVNANNFNYVIKLPQSNNTVTLTAAASNGTAFDEQIFHTPNTMFFPLLVSSGPDEVLGMDLPVEPGPERHAQIDENGDAANGIQIASPQEDPITDNITNRQ